MAITVQDLLKLPCLREATVLGGNSGLTQTVSSISVLEYSFMNDLQKVLASTVDFYGNEIVITAFANAKDSVETQLANIHQLASAGEVGLILYYVGIVLPKVDPRLVELANELAFPLICMPENRYDLRYSEVISEVMEAIFQDQLTDTWFQGEILERVSRLPTHQRSVDTVMRMLSDRVRTSLVLTNSEGRTLNTIAWPRTLVIEQDLFPPLAHGELPPKIELWGGPVHIARQPVHTHSGAALQLFILKQGEALKPETTRQLAEVLGLSIGLWSRNHGQDILPDLVQAILQDEPVKMRRIAEIFGIDVASIHNMWVLTPGPAAEENIEREAYAMLRLARERLCTVCQTVVGDVYDGRAVLFMDEPSHRTALQTTAEALVAELAETDTAACLSTFYDLRNTTEVRAAYLLDADMMPTARTIYPGERLFSAQRLSFAHLCSEILRRGEAAVEENTALLDTLHKEDRLAKEDLCDTLAVYMLDSGFNTALTAQRLYLHKNTIKYRLARISENLGFSLGSMPESIALYTALALRRLLAQNNASRPPV